MAINLKELEERYPHLKDMSLVELERTMASASRGFWGWPKGGSSTLLCYPDSTAERSYRVMDIEHKIDGVFTCSINVEMTKWDREFIATFDPVMIAAMLARIQNAEARVSEFEKIEKIEEPPLQPTVADIARCVENYNTEMALAEEAMNRARKWKNAIDQASGTIEGQLKVVEEFLKTDARKGDSK